LYVEWWGKNQGPFCREFAARACPYLFTSYADTAGTQVVNQVEDIYGSGF
jgi:hypothetical protein